MEKQKSILIVEDEVILSNIPIIFMTGYENKQADERIQKINPVAFLIKPVEIWDLKPVLELLF